MIGLLLGTCLINQLEVYKENVRVSEPMVRISDIVLETAFEPQCWERIKSYEVLRLSPGDETLVFDSDRLTARIEERVPALKGKLLNQALRAVQIQHVKADTDTPKRLLCYELLSSLAEGAMVTAGDVVPVSCDAGRTAVPVYYDLRSRVTRISQYAQTGEFLGRIFVAANKAIDAGERIQLRIKSGPVTVERDLTILQTAQQKDVFAFAQVTDGDVLKVPLKNTDAWEELGE